MNDLELLQRAAYLIGKRFDPTRKDKRGLWCVKKDAVCQSEQELWNPLTCPSHAGEIVSALGYNLYDLAKTVGGTVGSPQWQSNMRRAVVIAAATSLGQA